MSDDKKVPEEFYQTTLSHGLAASITGETEPWRSFTFCGDEKGREATLDFGGEEIIYSGELPVGESAKKFFEAFHQLLKTEANKDIRQLLWLRHGCGITRPYGDDGEMQCSTCLIDFKRDSPESIKQRFTQLGTLKFGEPTAQVGGMVCDRTNRCAGWEKSITQIKLFQEFLESINQRVEYTGNKFKFCPWCGKEIKREI